MLGTCCFQRKCDIISIQHHMRLHPVICINNPSRSYGGIGNDKYGWRYQYMLVKSTVSPNGTNLVIAGPADFVASSGVLALEDTLLHVYAKFCWPLFLRLDPSYFKEKERRKFHGKGVNDCHHCIIGANICWYYDKFMLEQHANNSFASTSSLSFFGVISFWGKQNYIISQSSGRQTHTHTHTSTQS